LFHRNEAIDQATIGHELGRLELLGDIGGYTFLSQVGASVPTSLNIEYYGQIVRQTSAMRQLIQAAGKIAELGYKNGPDLDDTLSRAEDVLFQIRSVRSTGDFVHLREVMDQYLEDRNANQSGILAKGASPITTGLLDIDQLLGGMQRSDLIVVAARPAAGKSALALSIARNAARMGFVSSIFSLEMSREQLGLRLLAADARVDLHRLRLGLYTDADERRIVDSVGVLSDLPIYIDDTPLLGMAELRSKARRLHMEKGLDLLILDYLQLLQGTESRGQNRVQEISDITRALKALARDLNVPVIAVSQLSRAVEMRPSHRPQLSDLRESGSIEQDADVVMFIYREDMYTTEEEWEQRSPGQPYPRNIAEVIVAKHRHGPVATLHLQFQDKWTQFVNMAGSGRES
jgi:replicative DNA helicase